MDQNAPVNAPGSGPVNVRAFADIGLADIEEVGGKNASLGEMVGNLAELGVRVPEALSVVGFDEVDMARLHRINLTTDSQPRSA